MALGALEVVDGWTTSDAVDAVMVFHSIEDLRKRLDETPLGRG